MPVDQALVSGGQVSATDADGMELVHLFGDRQELRNRAKGLSPKIHVGSGHNHSDPPVCQGVGDPHHARIQELGLIDGDNLSPGQDRLGYLNRVGNGEGIGPMTVMGHHRE
jgi:hypothetical protein